MGTKESIQIHVPFKWLSLHQIICCHDNTCVPSTSVSIFVREETSMFVIHQVCCQLKTSSFVASSFLSGVVTMMKCLSVAAVAVAAVEVAVQMS